ncbi:F-box/RNI/FBD-like domain protein, partial [Trifolium medium]|nr:F-box/RNI/FBD-like domain protein [Trifolium medium]
EYKGEFKSLTNLVRADISNLNSCDVPLEAFSNVQFLRVEEMYGHVPVFPNLTHAELVFQRNVDWSWVFRVLEKLPKLQNLVLEMPEHSTSVESCILIPSISPECFSSQFKECTMTNYRGQKHQLQFAQYIMLNSTNLWRMIICSPSSMNDEGKLAMQMEFAHDRCYGVGGSDVVGGFGCDGGVVTRSTFVQLTALVEGTSTSSVDKGKASQAWRRTFNNSLEQSSSSINREHVLANPRMTRRPPIPPFESRASHCRCNKPHILLGGIRK